MNSFDMLHVVFSHKYLFSDSEYIQSGGEGVREQEKKRDVLSTSIWIIIDI